MLFHRKFLPPTVFSENKAWGLEAKTKPGGYACKRFKAVSVEDALSGKNAQRH